MFHEDMLSISYRKYIKHVFLISNMQCKGLHLDKFKGDLLNFLFFLNTQIPDFQIVVSRPNIVLS